MSGVSSVSVRVPGTTANLGPGFDCIGAALTIYNTFEFSRLPASAETTLQVEVTGLEADRVATDESNLVYKAFLKLYQHLGQTPPPIKLAIALNVPLSRGLGSSATAIVGGLVGANALAGSLLSREQVMQLAIAIEGHPDNVVPALLGGCRLAAANTDQTWTICDVSWHPDIVPVVAIPNFDLPTAEARRVMPTEYSRTDAIFNIAHLGLLLRGLETAKPDWLSHALQDRIHHPYRQPLIHGYAAVEAAALEAGAYGLVISGAGPTLLALTPPEQTSAVALALSMAWSTQGIGVQTKVLELDHSGAIAQIQP